METQLLSVSQLAKKHPGITEGAVRWDLFNRSKNGLADSGAIIRRGRRVLLDEPRYLEWLRSRAVA
jgi:hypothetical protein